MPMIPGKRLYDALPVWAQSAAVRLVGSRRFRHKYGRTFHEALGRLEGNERKSRDQLLAEQRVALLELARYAKRHVPYYRRLGLPDDPGAWPLLDKHAIGAQPEQFLSDAYRPSQLLTLKTSGTTGTPLTVRVSPEAHQVEMAFRWRHKAWGGAPFVSRGAYVSGHAVVPAAQMTPPFWRYDPVEQRLLCSSYHLTGRNLPLYLDALADYAPTFLHGYPSSLAILAGAMLREGRKDVRPTAVFTASETLLDSQRRDIEQAFETKVYNWYGNTELTCNIVECAAGRLHYRTDYGLLEILPDGAMIATGLHNRAMPLIRYRIGDVAWFQTGTCPCGCAFPLVERVEGRIEDYVRTPDGRSVGRLDHLFKDAVHVREAQLEQQRVEELIVRIVKADGFAEHEEAIIRTEARQRLGDAIQLRFEYVSAIPRTANGKFRFVVSSLSHASVQAGATREHGTPSEDRSC